MRSICLARGGPAPPAFPSWALRRCIEREARITDRARAAAVRTYSKPISSWLGTGPLGGLDETRNDDDVGPGRRHGRLREFREWWRHGCGAGALHGRARQRERDLERRDQFFEHADAADQAGQRQWRVQRWRRHPILTPPYSTDAPDYLSGMTIW